MLLFGGESSEHTVSISSARNVFAALNDNKYDVVLGYIDETGKWWLLDNMSDPIDTSESQQLIPVLGTGNFTTIPSDEVVSPDVILPILHGLNGEDGTVQGLAQLLHIPIVGCGVESSAITMDKVTTKQLLGQSGIRTVPYEVHLSGEPYLSYNQLSEKLGSQLFVKPANGGSSIGISKVNNDDELSRALVEAHRYDKKVLIEKSIKARELEVGVLGSGSKVQISSVGEIRPDSDFYSFESKYDAASQSQTIIPADISDQISEEIRKYAKQVYLILGCGGLARVDFFLSDDGTIYLNEVNTLPGFTNISMYPKLWRQEGVSYSELIDTLISDALEKK